MNTSDRHASARAAVLRQVRTSALADVDTSNWPRTLAGLLTEVGASWRESADVCTDVAWQARARGRSALLVMPSTQLTLPQLPPMTARTYRHLYLGTLRFDFRCLSIDALVRAMPRQVSDTLDCYSRALHAFAQLGKSRTVGLPLMQQVLDEADDHPKTLHVLLHGLWLGHGLPQREQRMLDLLEHPALNTESDAIALYRKAGALRALGHHHQALTTIDQALEVLPPGDVSVHADLVRERSLITALAQLGPSAGALR